MSRPTLKLPAKSVVVPADSRPSPRQPLRGGIKGKKPARPAPRITGAAATVERDVPRRERLPARSPAASSTVVPAPAKKVYPPRGIARSTGARALPPPRRVDAAVGETAAAPAPSSPATADRAETPARRPLVEPPRLAKRVAEMAQCSRRQADEWIENGWVRVDGAVVTTLGSRVSPRAKVDISDAASAHHSVAVTIIYNKAAGVGGEAAAASSLIGAANRWAGDDRRVDFVASQLRGLALAGRLDVEACGMLVFTQEGSVARRITGDDARLEKEYIVRVDGEIAADGLQRLNHGLELDDVKLKRAQVSWQNERQLRFVLHERRPRQIARMCELVGLRVLGVRRIRIGSVSLGPLPEGQWRYLREDERF